MKKVIIELKDWDYHCGDGCCSEYGTQIIVNGEDCENSHAGGDVEKSIEFLLTKLGIEFEIKQT